MPSNSEIARRFENGYTKGIGSNMFIEDDIIYSYGYHFKIAKRFDKDGIDYLFTTNGYSNTTERHKSLVSRYITGTVLYIMGCNIEKATEQFKTNNDEIDKLKGKIERARIQRIKDNYNNRIDFLEKQNSLLSKYVVVDRLDNSSPSILNTIQVA